MNYCVCYVRVSSKDQELEGFSIPAQLKILREYARKNNLIVVQEFTEAETAKKSGRTQLAAMLKLIDENKGIEHVVVEKTDRLLRNSNDYAFLDNLTADTKIKVHLVKENLILNNKSRSDEKLVFGINAVVAKFGSDRISEEVKKGMEEKAFQGTYPSYAPYGYINIRMNSKSFIQTDPIAATYVKQIFELYATGSYSLLKLKRKMISDGMIYRNGKTLHKSTIENILKNEFYTGIFFWKGKKYENASHETLISQELFQRVQSIMVNPNKSKSRKSMFSFSNLITCGICKCKFVAELKKGKYIYYHCSRSNNTCKQDYLRQEVIDNLFTQLFEKIYIPEEIKLIILENLRKSFADKVTYHNNLIEQLNQQIKRIQNRIDQAYLDKLDGKISESFWQNKTEDWTIEKETLYRKLQETEKADNNFFENADFIIELAKNAAQSFKKASIEKKTKAYRFNNIELIYDFVIRAHFVLEFFE